MNIANLFSSTFYGASRLAQVRLYTPLTRQALLWGRVVWSQIQHVGAVLGAVRGKSKSHVKMDEGCPSSNTLEQRFTAPTESALVPNAELSRSFSAELGAEIDSGLKTPTKSGCPSPFAPTTPEKSPPQRLAPARRQQIRRTVHKLFQEEPLALPKVPQVRSDAQITQLVVNGWPDVLQWGRDNPEHRGSFDGLDRGL